MNIFITGSSSGFGLGCVKLLLSRGHKIVASIRGGHERFREIYHNELLRYPGMLHSLDLDLSTSSLDNEKILNLTTSILGGTLDVLINNAGIGYYGPVEALSDGDIRRQMEINFFSPLKLIQTFLPLLIKNHGAIINIGSVAGISAFPFYGAYNASKFSLEGLSEGLWYELKAKGVSLYVVNPGAYNTGFNIKSVLYGSKTEQMVQYEPQISKFKLWLKEKGKYGQNPDAVYKKIANLVEKRPKAMRFISGRDANLITILRRFLPHIIYIYFIDLMFKLMIFGFNKENKK